MEDEIGELREYCNIYPNQKGKDFNEKEFDPNAAGGMAYRLGQKTTIDGTLLFRKPLTIGVYDKTNKKDGPHITIESTNIPQDGKYHLYKIGEYAISERTFVWTGDWRIQVYLNKAYFPPLARRMEIYVSIKVCGPAYVKDSADENSISVDRVILVPTDDKK